LWNRGFKLSVNTIFSAVQFSTLSGLSDAWRKNYAVITLPGRRGRHVVKRRLKRCQCPMQQGRDRMNVTMGRKHDGEEMLGSGKTSAIGQPARA